MQINIAICDDDTYELETITTKISEISKQMKIDTEIHAYTSGNKLFNAIRNVEESIDILLLDIDMPEISGLEVAKLIKGINENIILIFVSGHEQYVFKSFECNPFRFVRKNKISDELPFAIKASISRLEADKDKCIIVKTDDGEKRLYYSEIMYYETEARKLKIYLNNGKTLTVRKTIKEFSLEINDERFILLHSGCVVNVKYISEYSSFDVTLDNGKRLIVSRRRIKDVKEELLKYWRGKV